MSGYSIEIPYDWVFDLIVSMKSYLSPKTKGVWKTDMADLQSSSQCPVSLTSSATFYLVPYKIGHFALVYFCYIFIRKVC